jgi:hypothetical protein
MNRRRYSDEELEIARYNHTMYDVTVFKSSQTCSTFGVPYFDGTIVGC